MYNVVKKHHVLVGIVLLLTVAVFMGTGIATKVLATQSETYEKLKIFTEVLGLVETNYVEEVDIQEVIYGGIHGMLRILDPHSSFMPPEVYNEMQIETRGNFGGLGIQIAIRDDQLTVIAPIDDTPAFRAGVEAGDRIIQIEETSTKDMLLMEAVKLLRGPKGTSVTITIMRDSFEKPKEFTITRDIIELKSATSRMLLDGIGYVRLRQFSENTATELEDSLNDLEAKSMEAVILDLRNNPGGLLQSAADVSDKFLEEGKLIVSIEGRKKSQNTSFWAHDSLTHPNYPMAILVNHGSASASEIVAGALQAHSRAIVIGTQTYGKGSVQSVIPLSDGSGLRLTTAKYFTPDGQSIHEKGITPDIIVEFEPPALAAQENPEETPTPEPEELENITEPIEDEDKTEEEQEVEQLLRQDPQLQRAMDVLKGVLVFERKLV
jgi:carboxyl-terminal processing protease